MNTKGIPKNVVFKLKTVVERVKLHFTEFQNYDFHFTAAEFDTRLVVDYPINISFSNSELKLKIIVRYQPFDIDKKEIDFISFEIHKEDDSEDYIEFHRFIEKFHPNLGIDKDYLFYINKGKTGTFSENIDIVIQLYKMYLLEFGEDIVCGRKWENGLKFEWTEQLSKIIYDKQKEILSNKTKKKD